MTKYILLTLSFILNISYMNSLGHLPKLLNLSNQEELFSTFDDTIKKQLTILQENKEQVKSASQVQKELDELNKEITIVKEKLKNANKIELKKFLQEKLSILNQQYQAISEVEQTNSQITQTIDSHMRILCQYMQDPDFSQKDLRLTPKRLYSFSEVQEVYNKILEYEKELKELEANKKKALEDLANREKTYSLLKQKYQEKKKQTSIAQAEDKEIKKDISSDQDTNNSLSDEQEAELMDEQEELLKYKNNLAEQKIQETKQKISLLESKITTSKIQLEILYEEYEKAKNLVKVTDSERQKAQASLESTRQNTSKKQKEYKEKIGALLIAQDSLEDQVDQYKTKLKLSDSDIQSISECTYTPNTKSQWENLVKINKAVIKLALNNISKQLLESRGDLAKSTLKEQEVNSSILSTWNKLTQTDMLNKQEELSKEIKQYETMQTELQSDLSSIGDKKSAISNLLSANAKLIDNLKETKKSLKSNETRLFPENSQDFKNLYSQLKNSERDLKNRSELISKLNEVYISTSNNLNTASKKISGIISELKSQAQWLGIARSIWRGLRNLTPDIKRFFKDLQQAVLGSKSIFTINTLENAISYYDNNIYKLGNLLFKLLLALILFFLIKYYIPNLRPLIGNINTPYAFGNKLINFFIILINFAKKHLLGILLWLGLLAIVNQISIINPYFGVLFYLISIPYVLYYVHKFIVYFSQTNIKYNYLFISEDLHSRFFKVFSFLSYATATILLFRHAFLLANYPKSDVPTTLLAINFFILQISLVFFISREQILSLIPTRSIFGETVHELVDKYYYLFLAVALAIIFISNPYIGFGPQFFSIIIRIIGITLLVPLFTVLHTYVKKSSLSLFFKTKGGITKERFNSAKTFYGIFVILSFLFFIALVFIIGANVWGYDLGWEQIQNVLDKPLFPSGSFEGSRPIFVTSYSLLKAAGFIILGLITAYLVNRFILRRMFELLLVNIGVQSALMSLTRYFILIVFLIIGLQTAHLSSILIYIFAIIGGIGFAAKDLVTDVLSYFIILIQRPLKIGDLVKVNHDVIGVVRQITLRSIVLRSKNSVTIIIPNSYVMNNPVTNWNYSPTFIGTNDISLTVPYGIDPRAVKEIILKVLNQNINILKNPAPVVWLSEFAENGYLYTIRGFLSPDKVLEVWEVTSEIRLEIVRTLKENNIPMATPTRVIVATNQNNLSTEEQDHLKQCFAQATINQKQSSSGQPESNNNDNKDSTY